MGNDNCDNDLYCYNDDTNDHYGYDDVEGLSVMILIILISIIIGIL